MKNYKHKEILKYNGICLNIITIRENDVSIYFLMGKQSIHLNFHHKYKNMFDQ